MRIARTILALALFALHLPAEADESTRPWIAHRVLDAHATRTRAVTFDRDGTVLVSGGSDRRLRVWDARTFEPLAAWRAPKPRAHEP